MPNNHLIEIATRHSAHLERVKSHEIAKHDKFLVEMADTVRRRLSGRELTDYTRARLDKLLKKIGEDLQDITGKSRGLWREQIIDLAEYEAGFEVRSLSQVVDHNFVTPTRSQISSAVFSTPLSDIGGASQGSMLTPFFQDWERATVRRVQGSIMAGYYRGDTTPQIVRGIIGTKGMNFGDGELAIVKRQLETVVRTSLQHASAQAREATGEANSDIITGVRIVATLDSRTSTQCQALDGQEFARDKGPRPPFHPNCRTTFIFTLDKRFKVLEEGGTRRDRDPETGKVGQTDADETYYSWLKRQPADVQDSIIGPARGKLLRDGGLSSERFAALQLNRNFEPMTLEQMRALEPTAFKRAGV